MDVFVYGLLMPNFEKWAVISNKVKNALRAKINAKLYHLPYGYPALVEGDGEVFGYVLNLPDSEEINATLDNLFGYYMPGRDNLFEKKYLPVTYEDGSRGDALVYLYEGYRAEELSEIGIYIPHGDWGRFIKERQQEASA